MFYDETCDYFDGFLVSLDGEGRPGPEVFFHLGTQIITYIDMIVLNFPSYSVLHDLFTLNVHICIISQEAMKRIDVELANF